MTDQVPSIDDLDALTTDELRHRAFEKAEHAHDVRFFWDLVKHLPSSAEIAAEDGSTGGISGTITELVTMAKQWAGHDLGGDEIVVRAHFIAYLRGA